MHTSKILALSLLSAVTAAPAPQTYTDDPNYTWSVTNWDSGCSLLMGNEQCHYLFNIDGPAYNNIPAFSASCKGNYEGSPFAPCTITDTIVGVRSVDAKLLRRGANDPTWIGAHLAVSYQFAVVGSTTEYNFTGFANTTYIDFQPPYLNFTITPTQALSVV